MLSSAIRIFITLYLNQEDNKEIRIKNNRKNIMNELNIEDLWDKAVFKDKNFKSECIEIKKFSVQINQILYLYELLGGDIEKDYFADVLSQIEENQKLSKKNPTLEEQREIIEERILEEQIEQKKEIPHEEEEEEEYFPENDEESDDFGGRD